MRKAAGSNYMSGQARELQVWVDGKKLEDKLYRELDAKQQKKDSAEILMDTIGQGLIALAGILFITLLCVNIPRLLGWW